MDDITILDELVEEAQLEAIKPIETLQAAFDIAYTGLRDQGFQRSIGADRNGCMYRGPSGRKCAVGHMVPDTLIKMRSNTVDIISILAQTSDYYDARWKKLFSSLEIQNIKELQQCHDSGTIPETMKNALHAFADKHNLTIPE